MPHTDSNSHVLSQTVVLCLLKQYKYLSCYNDDSVSVFFWLSSHKDVLFQHNTRFNTVLFGFKQAYRNKLILSLMSSEQETIAVPDKMIAERLSARHVIVKYCVEFVCLYVYIYVTLRNAISSIRRGPYCSIVCEGHKGSKAPRGCTFFHNYSTFFHNSTKWTPVHLPRCRSASATLSDGWHATVQQARDDLCRPTTLIMQFNMARAILYSI